MEFLIECSIKILVQECLGKLKTLEGHLRCLSGLGSHDISPAGRELSQSCPYGNSRSEKRSKKDPEQRGTEEESSGRNKTGFLDIDEPDVPCKILHIFLNSAPYHCSTSICLISTGHTHRYRRGLQCHIFLLGDIII